MSHPARRGTSEPAHGAEAAEEVLVDPGPDVVQARPAVGGRRALVEDPRLGAPRAARWSARRPGAPPSGPAPLPRGRRSRRRRGPGGTTGTSSRVDRAGRAGSSTPTRHRMRTRYYGRPRVPQLTRARTPRGPSPDRVLSTPDRSVTAIDALRAGLLLRAEDGRPAPRGAGRTGGRRGRATGQVRLHLDADGGSWLVVHLARGGWIDGTTRSPRHGSRPAGARSRSGCGSDGRRRAST